MNLYLLVGRVVAVGMLLTVIFHLAAKKWSMPGLLMARNGAFTVAVAAAFLPLTAWLVLRAIDAIRRALGKKSP